ncbi:OLC1v1025543C1 [Oldenlandia corymbosa var. corymbosa]|uniref:OLC1v1025543C1 n=1 Tax=Oldenlandia corymbosa var. corymbosa TaxID=529605 RepID=A0AAV1C4Z6_OLDCO|nr:OLC1v1025543C1 [Oldenlandia corymbosa var. corymbosa]
MGKILVGSTMKKRRKRSSKSTEIPQDRLAFEVLARLLVKNLLLCRCVCKLWNSIISDSKFIETHQKRSESRAGGNYLATLWMSRGGIIINFRDHENRRLRRTVPAPISFKVPPKESSAILSMALPLLQAPDRWIWHHTKNGCHSVRSAYFQLMYSPLFNHCSSANTILPASRIVHEFQTLHVESMLKNPDIRLQPLLLPPPTDAVKVSFDGSISRSNNCSGAGVLIQSPDGSFIHGLARQFPGIYDSDLAEALAFREALLLCRKLGLSGVSIQGDSSMIILAAMRELDSSSPCSPVMKDVLYICNDLPRGRVVVIDFRDHDDGRRGTMVVVPPTKLKVNGHSTDFEISHPLNGLVYLYTGPDFGDHHALVLNITTRQIMRLPKTTTNVGKLIFCFDDKTGKYKVLRQYWENRMLKASTYTLNGQDSSWRLTMDPPRALCWEFNLNGPCPCVNGTMYWLVGGFEANLVAFDVGREDFGVH